MRRTVIILVVLLFLGLHGSAQVVHYGDQTSAGTTASTSVEAQGSSWMITIRSSSATRDAIEQLYHTIVEPISLGDGLCAMDAFYGSPRVRLALVCPADPSVKDSLVSALSSSFGTASVTVTENAGVGTQASGLPIQWRVYRNTVTGPQPKSVKVEPVPIIIKGSSITVTNVPWNHDRIDSRERIYDNAYTYDADGSGTDVWIVDTGVRCSHSEVVGRCFWRGNTYDNLNEDCAGHGTHVAGIVGGTNYGVAKGVMLYIIKCLGCNGEGTVFSLIAALEMVISKRDPARSTVVNLSLSAPKNADIDEIIDEMFTLHGILPVAAAGNDRKPASQFSPSGAPGALAVGATTKNDTMASFSNYGSSVRIAAPGVKIISAWGLGDDFTSAVLDGTSMAAPHISAIAALVWSTIENKTDAALVVNTILQRATHGVLTGSPGGSNPPLGYSRLVDTPVTVPTTAPSSKPPSVPTPKKSPSRPPRGKPPMPWSEWSDLQSQSGNACFFDWEFCIVTSLIALVF